MSVYIKGWWLEGALQWPSGMLCALTAHIKNQNHAQNMLAETRQLPLDAVSCRCFHADAFEESAKK